MRAMSSREQEYQDKGVEILVINAFEDPNDGKRWIASSGLDYHWTFADDAVTDAYGVQTVPTQIILDREGKVVWASSVTSMFGGADAIYEALDAAL
jgi:peroxiredoxin